MPRAEVWWLEMCSFLGSMVGKVAVHTVYQAWEEEPAEMHDFVMHL